MDRVRDLLGMMGSRALSLSEVLVVVRAGRMSGGGSCVSEEVARRGCLGIADWTFGCCSRMLATEQSYESGDVLPLCRELAFSEAGHETGTQSIRLEAQASRRTPADVEYERYRFLVCRSLEEELVLDEILVDEISHIRARVPTHALCVHIDFSQHFDHIVLV